MKSCEHNGKHRPKKTEPWILNVESDLPSGKRLHSYGKSPCLMGKSTINDHFQQLF